MSAGVGWSQFFACACRLIEDLPSLGFDEAMVLHRSLLSLADRVVYDDDVVGDIDREVNMPVLLVQVQQRVFEREFAHAFSLPPLHIATPETETP